MATAAAIDAYTGPGRRTTTVVGNVTELTFKPGKKVIEVTNSRGELGMYDMAQVSSIQITSDGDDFNLMIMSKSEEESDSNRTDAERSKPTHIPGSDTGTGKETGDSTSRAESGDTLGTA